MIKCLVLNGVKQVGFTEGGSFRILLRAPVVPFLPAALGLPTSSPCVEHLEMGPEGWTLGGPLAQC